MSSFYTTLLAVLNEQSEIKELPSNHLAANIYSEGERLPNQIPRDVFLKIARLQTLIVNEGDRSEMPSAEEEKNMREQLGVDFLTLTSKALCVKEDATRRIMMLEGMIIEIVRSILPEECDQFNMRYCACFSPPNSHYLLRAPAPQQRFLD